MLLSDIEIEKHVINHDMINPFNTGLIRKVEEQKVISYGLSSFGYDIRLSSKEFKIFRHIPGEIVDPKDFNPDFLEDAQLKRSEKGEFFIIPANSYGLGCAIERLEIPNDVSVVCHGKSTYARCFSGDTKVKLVDGDFTFLELIDRLNKGERLYGYGVKNGEIVIQELFAPRFIENSNLVRIILDSGEFFDCTPDHKILLRSGEWVEAQNLKNKDSLHPIYEHSDHGYPTIFDSVKADSLTSRLEGWGCVHRMVYDYMVSKGQAVERPLNWHTHHKDGNRKNNHPDNLEILSPSEHITLHNLEDSRYILGGQEFKRLYENDLEFRTKINKSLHSEETKKKSYDSRKEYLNSDVNKEILKKGSVKRWNVLDSRLKQSEVANNGVAALKRRDDITEETLTNALLKTGTVRGAARELNVDRSAFRRFNHILESFKNGELCYNHKVEKVEFLQTIQPTYCLTSETGNFALSAGVFVSNCGISANITPAEAGWKGILTLEFSNSSKSDVKIYANEGVAQLLFFKSDHRCKTSYSDRNGKYQDQRAEITLPLV